MNNDARSRLEIVLSFYQAHIKEDAHVNYVQIQGCCRGHDV